MSEHIPHGVVRVVRARAGRICEYCHLPQILQEAAFHIDHISPRSRKGSSDIDNLALACVTCSLRKAALTPVIPSRRGERTRGATPTLSWRSADVGSPDPFNVGRIGSLDGAWARQNPHSAGRRFRFESRRVSGRSASARTAHSSLLVHILSHEGSGKKTAGERWK
jgi:HNH endonuclease